MDDRPKSLAPIGSDIFLDILISFLEQQGIKNFILGTGYMKDQIRNHINARYSDRKDLSFQFSEEESPLGTGGALKKALIRAEYFPCVVVNGDSFLPVDIKKFLSFHGTKNALFSLVLAPQPRSDGGHVMIDDKGKIVDFQEKTNVGGVRFMNGGIYACERGVLDKMPDSEVFSLEYDLFPRLAKENQLFGYPVTSEVIDIGTPERLQDAQNKFTQFFNIS